MIFNYFSIHDKSALLSKTTKRKNRIIHCDRTYYFFVISFFHFSGFQDFSTPIYRGFCNSQNIHVPTIYKTHPAMLEQ